MTGEHAQNRQVPQILLATSADWPSGEPGADLLDAAVAGRGLDAAWARWDDPTVDWGAASLVAARATWDYTGRLAEFLDWARSVEAVTRLLNGAETFAWNADKAYLVGLADLVPTVPTRLLDDPGSLPPGPVVVKPRTGASGHGVVLLDGPVADLTGGPWVAQPVVESVRTQGESSVFVLGGRAVSQFDKWPGAGEIRVHEHHGGRSERAPLDPAAAALAERACAAVGGPAYARVDLMHWPEPSDWAVSELELIEPGLYLDVDPVNAEPFAALLGTACQAPREGSSA